MRFRGSHPPPCTLARTEVERHLLYVEDDLLSRATVIKGRKAAAALGSARQRHILLLFASAPLTLAEAAARSGMELKSLYHHARKLHRAGLLAIVGERPRAGRPMKLYQAVADMFFVRDEALPQPFTHSLAEELSESLLRHGFRPGRGILFGIDPSGEPMARRVDGAGARSEVLDLWFLLHVRPQDLPKLKAELSSVAQRYDRSGGSGAKPYLVHAAAAPRSRDLA